MKSDNFFAYLIPIVIIFSILTLFTVPSTNVPKKVDGIEYKVVTIESNKFIAYKVKGDYYLAPLR